MKKQTKERKNQTANREYKNSVFTLLFSVSPERLYEAITGKRLAPGTKVMVVTLTDVLFRGRLNDLAFIVDDKLVVIIEHQSTINPNMPLRILGYFGKTTDNYVISKYGEHAMYGEKKLKIPRPEFIMLYNGQKELPGGVDRYTMKLSDMFAEDGDRADDNRFGGIDLEVEVFNINKGRNPEMAARCEELDGYETFIQMIRDNEKSGKSLEEAVRTAVLDCIDQNILKDFLEHHKMEVIEMLVKEWSFEAEVAVREKDAWEEGMEKGREKGRMEGIKNVAKKMIAKDINASIIAETTGLPIDTVLKLQGEE